MPVHDPLVGDMSLTQTRRSAARPKPGLQVTVNGLFKTECIYGPDTNGWDDVDGVELATLSWVHWFNEQRLHSHCDDVPPAEFEATFYAAQQPDPTGVGNQ